MTIFTPQERRVVLFLMVTLLAGSAVKLYRSREAQRGTPTSAGPLQFSGTVDSASIMELDTLIEEVQRKLSGIERVGGKPVIDLNAASESELCLLPGIGPKLARRIADYRKAHGKFKSTKDLLNVPGIGEKKLAGIANLVFTDTRRAGEEGAGE